MVVTVLRTSDGKLDQGDLAKLSALEARLAEGFPKTILYLHGGLVDQASAEAMATRLSGASPDGLNAPDAWEQIYIVWRTGGFETLKANWLDLFDNDRLYRAVFKRLISFVSDNLVDIVSGGRGARAPAGKLTDNEIEKRLRSGDDQPFSDLDERVDTPAGRGGRAARFSDLSDRDIEMELGTAMQLDNTLDRLASSIDAQIAQKTADVGRATFAADPTEGAKSLTNLDDKIKRELEEIAPQGRARALIAGGSIVAIAKHGVAIGKRVISRLRSGRDHGIHATIAEEIVREFYGDLIGSIVWGMMVKDAGDHFKAGALGSRLVTTLNSNPDASLLVVGHSAGSIWAGEFLKARQSAGAAKVNVVFLAPAIRISKFAEVVETAGASIAKFRTFAMSDDLERKDVLLGKGYGFIYPSSLLYLVSGLFEETEKHAYVDAPLLGMDRFVGKMAVTLTEPDELASLQTVKDFLGKYPNSLVLSESHEGDGLLCLSHTHGDFHNDHGTLASIATYFA